MSQIDRFTDVDVFPEDQHLLPDRDRILIAAIRNRDRNSVESALRMGSDPNGRTDNGMPILFLAIILGNPDILQLLLDFDVDLTVNYSGYNCVDIARIFKVPDLEAMLVSSGGSGSWTPYRHVINIWNCYVSPTVESFVQSIIYPR